MEKRWKFIIGNVKVWAKLLGKRINILIVVKSEVGEDKTRITFESIEDYIFFVNQQITIGKEAIKHLNKSGDENIMSELKESFKEKQ